MASGYAIADFKGFCFDTTQTVPVEGLHTTLNAAYKHGKPVLCENLKCGGVGGSEIPITPTYAAVTKAGTIPSGPLYALAIPAYGGDSTVHMIVYPDNYIIVTKT